ncbi:MAG: hypothetical protein MZU97_11020 [Bacillus subtilis]|nr:hypothetical protein [Bacillus subtilis]
MKYFDADQPHRGRQTRADRHGLRDGRPVRLQDHRRARPTRLRLLVEAVRWLAGTGV